MPKAKARPSRHAQKLHLPVRVTDEMARLYRRSLDGKISVDALTKYSLVLERIHSARIVEEERAAPKAQSSTVNQTLTIKLVRAVVDEPSINGKFIDVPQLESPRDGD